MNVLGEPVDGRVVGRPVRFADSPEADDLAQCRFAVACRRAGLLNVRFELEPVAAGRHFASRADRPTAALVVDMGGGTLDLTVLRVGADWEARTVEGVPVAGDEFDRRIVEGCVAQHFGLNATMGPSGQSFPVHMPMTLTDWASIIGLNDPKTHDTIRHARKSSPRRRQIAVLEGPSPATMGSPSTKKSAVPRRRCRPASATRSR